MYRQRLILIRASAWECPFAQRLVNFIQNLLAHLAKYIFEYVAFGINDPN